MVTPMGHLARLVVRASLLAAVMGCGESEDANGSGGSPASGATCTVEGNACVSSVTGQECCTLLGHRVEVDEAAGCKRLIDPEWSQVLCVAPSCEVAAMITCYELEEEDGTQSIFLGNGEVTGGLEQVGLRICSDKTATDLLSIRDCS